MNKIFNGMSAGDVPYAVWRKSTRSGAQGNCVEMAELPTGTVALRNSRDPDGPALIFTHDELAAFVDGAKAGEFDLPSPRSEPPGTSPGLRVSTAEHQPTSTPSRYRVVGTELQSLTDRLLAGETLLDRESSERLLRILCSVALLHRMHRVDRNGNCAICRTKSRRWHPSSRHDVCSVYAALSLYLGRSLMASSESHETTPEPVASAQGSSRRSW